MICFLMNLTKRLLVPKQLLFWAALSWTGLILFVCLTPSSDIPTVSIGNLDKGVHAFFYLVFTMLWGLFLKKQLVNTANGKPFVISFFFSIFFGIGIEILQGLCTATRSADLLDVLANISGATLAVLLMFLYDKYSFSKK
jgi:VanZ family protein